MITATLAAAPSKITNLEIHASLAPTAVSSVTVLMIVSPALPPALPGTLLRKNAILMDVLVLLLSTEMVILAKIVLGRTVIPALTPLSVSPAIVAEPLMLLVPWSMVRLVLVSVPPVSPKLPMVLVNLVLLVAILAMKISQHVLHVLVAMDSIRQQANALLVMLAIIPLATSATNVLLLALPAPMLTLVSLAPSDPSLLMVLVSMPLLLPLVQAAAAHPALPLPPLPLKWALI